MGVFLGRLGLGRGLTRQSLDRLAMWQVREVGESSECVRVANVDRTPMGRGKTLELPAKARTWPILGASMGKKRENDGSNRA